MTRHSPPAFSSSWNNLMLWTFRKSSPIPPSKEGPGPPEKLPGDLEQRKEQVANAYFGKAISKEVMLQMKVEWNRVHGKTYHCLISPNHGGPESVDPAQQGPSAPIPRCGASPPHWGRSQASQRDPWARSLGPRDLFYLSHRRFSDLGACAEGKGNGVLING